MINSWFIKVDSIYLYYKDIQLYKVNENIVSNHQAKAIMAAVAGFNELSITEANIFRKKIKSNKQYYYNFFTTLFICRINFRHLYIILYNIIFKIDLYYNIYIYSIISSKKNTYLIIIQLLLYY